MPRRTKETVTVVVRPADPKPLRQAPAQAKAKAKAKAPPKTTKALPVPDVNELKRRMNSGKPMEVTPDAPLKLRFGTHEEAGFTKMRSMWDDQVFVPTPWALNGKNLDDGSVDMIFLAWYFHRLRPGERFATMNEAWRVLRPGGQVMIAGPYWSSRRAVADPLAEWPPIVEESFYAYSKKWREGEGLVNLLPLTCDFASIAPNGELIVPAGHMPDPIVAQRNDEYRQHASRHFINSVWELHVTLTKVGG